jgi:hypothetical protein
MCRGVLVLGLGRGVGRRKLQWLGDLLVEAGGDLVKTTTRHLALTSPIPLLTPIIIISHLIIRQSGDTPSRF